MQYLNLALALAGLFYMTGRLHMLQQNSYYASRYLTWLRGNLRAGSLIFPVLALAAGLCVMFSMALPVLILAVCFFVFSVLWTVRAQKRAIKPLVFTARIKRMYGAALIVYGLLCLFSFLFPHTRAALTCVVAALAMLPDITVMLVLFLCWPLEKGIAAWYVRDARRILEAQPDLRVIGVTGSYGKTTTKTILGRLLREKYDVLVTPQSYNTPMGLVRTVREHMRPATQVLVAEMGAKQPGDIEELCRLARPSLGVITAVGPQHLETFGDLETVARTKFELAEYLKAHGGSLFLNMDSEPIAARSSAYNAVTYGSDPSCDAYAKDIECGPQGTSFTLVLDGEALPVVTRLLGLHNVLNITAAAAVAKHLGVSPDDIAAAVHRLQPIAHRLELKPFLAGSLLIDDAYNANPAGSLEAVHVLSRFAPRRRVIVTPGLVELGAQEYAYNEALGKAAGEHADVIILVGEKRALPLADGVRQTGFDKDQMHIVKSFAQAMELLREICDSQTVVLFENDLPDHYVS